MFNAAENTLEELYYCFNNETRLPRKIRTQKKEITLISQDFLKNWSPLEYSEKSNNHVFQVIDFFSGCGGMSLGFAAISKYFPFFKILGGCDIDQDAAKTFENNFKAPSMNYDLRMFEENEDELYRFLSKLSGYDEKKPLIVIGCAPCQGFSSHRKKNWHRNDKRNSLVGAFASVVVKLNPVCIIMENVPELLSHKYWNNYNEAKEIMKDAGYIIKQTIYNAASFGVPQERFRAIVIAMKRNFLLPEILLKPSQYMTVRQAIEFLPKIQPGKFIKKDRLHRSANHRKSTIDTIRSVPKNGGNRPKGVGPKCLDRVRGFYDVYGRLFWDKPAITITHYARNPASGRFIHPEQDRGLTIREAALLQSFPSNFDFHGSFDSIFKQIGEAVPPKFSCAIAANILIEMVTEEPNQNEIENGIKSINAPINNSYSSVIAGLKMRRVK